MARLLRREVASEPSFKMSMTSSKHPDPLCWQAAGAQLSRLIASRIGIVVQERDLEQLRGLIGDRLGKLSLGHVDDYENLLRGETPVAAEEWHYLSKELAIPETYFFRDKGHFNLLQKVLLPEIIERGRESKSIRIWSAGCSTGEEAYSLAILLHELLNLNSEFKATIIATDLSKSALEKARRGVYTNWAFRTVPPEIQEKYFRKVDDTWEIAEEIRSMVRFEYSNLVQDVYPDLRLGIYDLDLIICRNVFIYFQRETVAAVLNKFGAALKNDGYLITGHAEVYGNTPECFRGRQYQDALIYQKKNGDRREAALEVSLRVQSPVNQALSRMSAVRSALGGQSGGDCGLATFSSAGSEQVRSIPSEPDAPTMNATGIPTTDWEQHFRQAQMDADAGRYESAASWCHQALRCNPIATQPYMLLAQIAEHENELDDAKTYYRKVVYLAPDNIEAYIHLAALYDAEGSFTRARKMRSTALDLLRRMNADAIVAGYEDVKVADLIEYLESMPHLPKGTTLA